MAIDSAGCGSLSSELSSEAWLQSVNVCNTGNRLQLPYEDNAAFRATHGAGYHRHCFFLIRGECNLSAGLKDNTVANLLDGEPSRLDLGLG
jgi:hypothetical protein